MKNVCWIVCVLAMLPGCGGNKDTANIGKTNSTSSSDKTQDRIESGGHKEGHTRHVVDTNVANSPGSSTGGGIRFALTPEQEEAFGELRKIGTIYVNPKVTGHPIVKIILMSGDGTDLRWLQAFPDLEELQLSNKAKDISFLEPLEKLRFLYISSGITPNSLKLISNFKELEQLYLPRTTTSEVLMQLRELPHLTKLSLNHSFNLRDQETSYEGLRALKGLTHLTHLELPERVDDSGIQWVGELKKLELLRTRGHSNRLKLTNTGVASLSGLSQLRILDLNSNYITDDVVEHLKKLRNLKRLWLTEGRVTDSALVQLQKDIPGVEIDASGVSVASQFWFGLWHPESDRKLYREVTDANYWKRLEIQK